MAGPQSVTTDMGIGLSVVFVFLAVVSAAISFVTYGTVTAAWGFAGAVIAGVLAVAMSHLY